MRFNVHAKTSIEEKLRMFEAYLDEKYRRTDAELVKHLDNPDRRAVLKAERAEVAIIQGNFDPGFMVRLIQKDLNIVLDAARNLDLPMAGTSLCSQYFRSNEAHGEGALGTQAMFKTLERLANFELGD